MQSHPLSEINKEIMQLHDNLRVLDKRRITELEKLNKEMYKLIAEEIQLQLLIYTNEILFSLSNKLKKHQSVDDELALLQDAKIREKSNQILDDIKKTYHELSITKKLNADSIKDIDNIMDLSEDDDFKLTPKNFNFYKHIDSIITINSEDDKKGKLSLLDQSIKETNKVINKTQNKIKTIRTNIEAKLDGIVNIENAIKITIDEGAELINRVSKTKITPIKEGNKKSILTSIKNHKNKISFFNTKKKDALTQLMDSINNASSKNNESVSLESLISEWLFTYEKTIKSIGISKQVMSAWSGKHQESSTEKFIRELREEYGHVRINTSPNLSKNS